MYYTYELTVEKQDPDVDIDETWRMELGDEADAVAAYHAIVSALPGDEQHDDPIKDIPADERGPGLFGGEHVNWDEEHNCYWYVYMYRRDWWEWDEDKLFNPPTPAPRMTKPIKAYWVTVTVTGVARRCEFEFQGPVSGKRAGVAAFRAICSALMDRQMTDRELDAAITDIPTSPEWASIFQGDWTVYQEGEEPDEDVYWSVRLDEVKTAYAL